MKTKRHKSISLIQKIIGSFLLVLYSIICITCSFPRFHNHSQHNHTHICEPDDACGTKEPSHTQITIYSPTNDHHHGDAVCLACLWLALVQQHTVFAPYPQLFSELVNTKKIFLNDQLFSQNVTFNSEIRAPPIL